MRILGLDIGERRIGMAVSDEKEWLAEGLETLKRTSIAEDIIAIRAVILKYHIKELVVGLPLNMNGTFGKGAKEVERFIALLKERVNLSIKTWDERLTTCYSEKILLEADLSRKKRKAVRDKLAAQIILQSYLDSKNV